MKLLMIYATRFNYKTTQKGLESAAEIEEQKTFDNTVVGFIHAEEKDKKLKKDRSRRIEQRQEQKEAELKEQMREEEMLNMKILNNLKKIKVRNE